ncbi:MAG TPA: UbiX family flavin prenyltransferase [Vicinamibacteria bacterium]|nr:UbiX family flavin prenyltransferase [Vicinamibacteria bacterium]
MRRVVVGISGASGSIYGIRLLEQLRQDPGVEVHLVVSASGKRTLVEETPYTLRQVESLAHVVYDDRDVGASIASGSFRTAAMIVAPCSIKTLAALATSHADTLIARAGDVALKEGRPLLALVREAPLHVGHLRQMLAFAEMGGIVFPPVPAFYQKPKTVYELVSHTVARVLERLGLAHEPIPEWTGGGRTPSG